MYKKFPIVLAFLIIGGGVLWLSIKPSVSLFNSKTEEATKEETEEISPEEFEIEDEISIFLLRLKEDTNINFQEVKESDFNWATETEVFGSGSILVSGKAIDVRAITNEDQTKIENFFVDNNFKIDMSNTRSETIANTIGYRGGEFVCLYLSAGSSKEEGSEEDGVFYDVKVSCGVPDLDELEKIENKEDNSELLNALLNIFSQKYEKSKEEINLTVSKNTGAYASGGVSFSGEVSGAMWLVFKQDSDWRLIFDGNGTIPCELVLPYSFPADMVSECWDKDLEKLIKL